ncbi:hypothetical protein [Leptospira ilyithenensis]|uniref:Uncharacterized protein n=1 Tax=Leptospira ilyithenensis TaxID=2484901 RepID=A0A4R9LV68_9LEPT|nr:hypothetical protein [Leptospira ilyithenensis]TGN14704.1 hypothetical protein EHS11_01580 [Leptospira ilyithenensis]
MRFRFLLLISVLFLFFSECGISIRVYRPFPEEAPFELVTFDKKLTIITPNENLQRFALYDGYFVSADDLYNEYGSLSYLIQKEISIRKSRYPGLFQGAKIEITKFQLESLDKCFSNEVHVKMSALVQVGRGKASNFEYEDKIDSNVTNCYLLGSSLTVVPLIWYVPYMGFRGNRQDQLNQLGRNALEAFFQFLENESDFHPTKKEPNLNSLPTVPDPKLKEILEEL